MMAWSHVIQKSPQIEKMAFLYGPRRLPAAPIDDDYLDDTGPAEANSQMEVDFDNVQQTCCSLPFFLQDLCLLVVINELDFYPTELLAALPYWLRYRILSCVPALDLARLECTSVASGVDTNGIWKSQVKADVRDAYALYTVSHDLMRKDDDNKESPTKGNPFHLNFSSNHHLRSLTEVLRFGYIHDGSHWAKHIIRDLETKDSEISIGNQFMFEIASEILTNSNLEELVRRLVSIQGNLILLSLLTGSSHQDCRNQIECNEEVWKRQATALVVKKVNAFSFPYYGRHVIHLTPHRLMHFCDTPCPFELLSVLFTSCQLRPRGVNFCIKAVSQSILSGLCTETLALDGNLTLPSGDAKYMPIIHCFLENIVSLRLQCDEYGQIGVMLNMIKMAIAKGQASNLKHLICTVSDLYMDIAGPLCSLFLLEKFELLMLDVSNAYPLALSHVIQAFVTTPCPHVQKLIVHIRDPQFQLKLKENQLASLDMKDTTIPPCSLKHKVLTFSSRDGLTNGLYLLLQLPVIRLKSLALFTRSENFHLCAAHPNLQMTKLEINVDMLSFTLHSRQNPQQKSTLREDIVSLFQIDSLQKIRISGVDVQESNEVKLGIVHGLQGRSHLTPLKKLSLELETRRSYEVQDLETLCNAIFSLPQLENLKLVLGRGFGDILSQSRYEDVLYKSWIHKAAGMKLKSMCLQTHEMDLKQVSLVTQTLTFSLPRRSERVSSPAYIFSGFYDYDDDFYGGSDDSYGYDPWSSYNYYDSDDY